MQKQWLPLGEAAKKIGVSRQKLWSICDRARHVNNRLAVFGVHWRHDGRRYLIDVKHPDIKEVFCGIR